MYKGTVLCILYVMGVTLYSFRRYKVSRMADGFGPGMNHRAYFRAAGASLKGLREVFQAVPRAFQVVWMQAIITEDHLPVQRKASKDSMWLYLSYLSYNAQEAHSILGTYGYSSDTAVGLQILNVGL